MWNNEEEFNESGEPVKLYVPANGPPRRKDLAAADSHIGGLSSVEGDPPSCAKCQDSMFLLTQLVFKRVPKQKNTSDDDGSSSSSFVDRTVCVFGCPKPSCFGSISFENGFCSGESATGVMCCKTIETPSAVLDKPAVPVAPSKSSWYTDDNADGADNDDDWGVSSSSGGGGGTDELSKLENAVAAMEANLDGGGSLVKAAKPQQKSSTTTKTDSSSSEAFDCYMLKLEREPIPVRQVVEADDVGLSASDDKIRNMLARYMAEEEDEGILAALRGTDMGGGIEEDERLTEEDRTLLGFQDRLKRQPRQVIRYAPNGVPLFSIPSSDAKNNGEPLWKKPACAGCGTDCVFEFQLLPQLLLFLKVDKFAAAAGKASSSGDGGGISGMLSSGMNWGSVAVFKCPNAECGHSDCSLVIQKSVDLELSSSGGQCDEEGEDTMTDGPIAVVEDLDDDDEFVPDA